MGKLEKKLTALGLAGALAFGSGCALATRPHTASERNWLIASTATNALETGLSIYGLNNGFGFYEWSPLMGNNPSAEKLILAKSAYLGLMYGLGELDPEHRSLSYKITTVIGAFSTAWNLAQILFNSPKEE